MHPCPGWSVVTTAIASLTQSLARPIVRGLLPYECAAEAIALAIYREPAVTDVAGALPVWLHILDLNIHNAEVGRDAARSMVKRAMRGLIPLHTPWPKLMAEAHDINGAAGFPLSEAEVSDVVKLEVYYALPPAPWSPRHGR